MIKNIRSKFHTLNARGGFTLIETIIYIALLGIVVMSISSYSLSLSAARNKNYAVQNVQANGRALINMMNEKVRECSSVTTPSPGASSGQLILDMGASPSITFHVSNGRVVLSQPGNPDLYITDPRIAVTSFIFTNNALPGERDSVSMQATVSANVVSGDVENSYTQQINSSITRRN